MEVVEDFHMLRDNEMFNRWNGSEENVERWCILKNNTRIGITNNNQLVIGESNV